MKVYVATSGEYSDYQICHVFRNREDAESYAGADRVEEYELREGPVEQRSWYGYYWNAGQPDFPPRPGSMGNPWEYPADRCDFTGGDPRHVEHRWTGQLLKVEGWDRDRVLKVYSEQRAQYIARQQGIA